MIKSTFLSLSLTILSSLLILTLAQQQQQQHNIYNQQDKLNELTTIVGTNGKDFINIPVRSGYRIIDNDDDGYLEDGIIVKTKGTGYIDPKYRKKYLKTSFNNNKNIDEYQPSSIRQRRHHHQQYLIRNNHQQQFKRKQMDTSESSFIPRYYSTNFYPKKYLKTEIIYGRRANEW